MDVCITGCGDFFGDESEFPNRTLVVDVGKTFMAAALEWFPKYGLRKIDAVLITHAHADGEFDLFC